MKTFFTSDMHFGHTNILKYDNRPFTDIREHDETLIKNWNEVAHKDDTIYFLGDFSLTRNEISEIIMKHLNGRKFFIKGNHDTKGTISLYQKYGTYLGQLDEITINKQHIVLCHYKMCVWNRSHYGSWHLFGHSHGGIPDDQNSLSLDVGINCHNYYPIEFEEVKKLMEAKNFKPKTKRNE